MNTDLFKISLNQGKQFNNYQNKIKKTIKSIQSLKEGFVNEQDEMLLRPQDDGFKSVLQNQRQLINNNNKANQQQFDQLRSLQNKYQNFIQQYNQIQKTLGDSSLEVINRTNNNKYLNKNIKFTDGTICYVTNQGIAKPYSTSDILKNNSGKNGCPLEKDIINLAIPWLTSYVPGSLIPTNPTLIVGENMISGESCGNEGKNIYASTLIDNPSSSYIGCYNDKPFITNINIVPIMNSSNSVNGFISGSSSIYLNNNDTFGPWAAFDQNPNTFWSSEDSINNKYNSETGIYEGMTSWNIINLGTVSGEYLTITNPNLVNLTQYSISPRMDSFSTSSPNSWYVLGFYNNQAYQIDRQEGQQFINSSPKFYSIPAYTYQFNVFMLLVDRVGNDDQTSNRSSVQIAEWNLFSNSLTTSNDTMAMTLATNLIGNSSFDQCQQYAIDNGYQYFGTTDYQSNGLSTCVVSNDISRTQMYGDGTNQTTAIPLWETNTSGTNATTCYVSSEGTLNINDSSGTVVWSSPNPPQDCLNGGYVNPDTIQGSFGGNCVGKPLNIDCGNPNPNQSYGTDGIVGNLNDILKNKANNMLNQTNWTYNPLTDWTGQDPAYCCSKTLNYSYQCGNGAFKTGEINGGTNINFDCTTEVSNCVFFLILQDDGNLCLNRGSDPSENKGTIWCSNTNGQQKSINSDWVSTKGKYGRNYLKNNETLVAGEWIGSNDGSMKLIMGTDGNLVLYTSEIKPGCNKNNNNYYGDKDINAVYKLNSIGNKNNLGKLAYIDSDSKLKEYPDSMISYSNDYQLYQGYDSGGNDLSTLQASTIDDCKTGCDNNISCAAFVYQSNTSMCWLKNSNAYPKGDKQINNTLVLGVRKPKLKGSSTCSNEIVDVDTIQYDNYSKGPNMEVDTDCSANSKPVSKENMDKYDQIKNNLFNLGQQIASEMENLYNQDNKIYEKLNMNEQEFNKSIAMYKNINNKIQSNNIEGMTNMNKKLSLNDINGMLTNTDLIVLQENYSYMFWSILAVTVLIVTINTMKK